MYGAKALAIGTAAWATWGNGKPMTDAVRDAVSRGVFLVADDATKTAADLPSVEGFPKALGHDQFVKLTRELAKNPLVS